MRPSARFIREVRRLDVFNSRLGSTARGAGRKKRPEDALLRGITREKIHVAPRLTF